MVTKAQILATIFFAGAVVSLIAAGAILYYEYAEIERIKKAQKA